MKTNLILVVLIFFLFHTAHSQVKIERNITTPLNPAILELDDTIGAFLPTRLSNQQMNNNFTPLEGMFLYNNSEKKPFYYNGIEWKGLSSDTSHWISQGNRTYLKSALFSNDSIYYNQASKQFVFSDDLTLTNSQGVTFNLEDFAGKYLFKSQASSKTTPGYYGTINSFQEVDNTVADSNSYNNMYLFTSVPPSNVQHINTLYGIDNGVAYGGSQSLDFLSSQSNLTIGRGGGYVSYISGFDNNVFLSNNRTANVGEIAGSNTFVSAAGNSSTYSVDLLRGNTIYLSPSIVGRANVDAVGLYIYDVYNSNKPQANQYSIYTLRGNTRLGDSVVISNTATVPRAILDINSTASMILPSGTTAQRPTSTTQGQQRYNTETNAVETYTGSKWSGILSMDVVLDVANIPAQTSKGAFFTFPEAEVGDVVVVNPISTMTYGLTIAWANVYANTGVEVHFANYTSADIDPLPQTFRVRLIK